MRKHARMFTPLLVILFAALLIFPSRFQANRNPVSAAAQDQSKADVPTRVKPKSQHLKQAVTSTLAAVPSNDNCANAIAVTSFPFTDTKDTTSATDETGEPQSTCTHQGISVWYSFTSVHGATVTVSTCNSNFDTAIMVWKVNGGPCDFANFAPVACNDDSCDFQSAVIFFATPGATYKIQVGGFDGETGTLVTNIDGSLLECDPVTVHGTLGTGSHDWPSTSGQQTPARLFRDGVPSSCGAPKTCPGAFGSGSFTYDAYTFSNSLSSAKCVTVFSILRTLFRKSLKINGLYLTR